MKRSAFLIGVCVFYACSTRVTALEFDCTGVPATSGSSLTLEEVATGLNDPVNVTSTPLHPDLVFVVEQAGLVKIVDITTRQVVGTFLDIDTKVFSGGELGLLGFAFDPDYANNGYVYVNYTRFESAFCDANPAPGCQSDSAETVVSRFKVSSDNALSVPSGSEKVLLEICQPFSNHNGGSIHFSPLPNSAEDARRSYLYISTGDGGSGGDPCDSGQRLDSLLGKILRIDVDSGAAPYLIPGNNPFVDTPGARPEIWDVGLRNPWRMSFDSLNGDLYIGDVGQDDWEEIDFEPGGNPGGNNYEWKLIEGDGHRPRNSSFPPVSPRIRPLIDYPQPGVTTSPLYTGTSVTGGVVYRGCRIPAIHGRYFYADYNNTWVRSLLVVANDAGGGNITYEATDLRDHAPELNAGITGSIRKVAAMGTDAKGEIYFCARTSGRLFKLIPVGPVLFSRGDANSDGFLDISDGVRVLITVFLEFIPPLCLDAADTNDDGGVNVADASYLFNWIFLNGPGLDEPKDCGEDPTEDALGCEAFTACQ